MRFLPSLDADTIWNPFLSTVIRGIDAELGKVDVLRPASLGALKRIQDMRCTSDFLDQHGDPLLPDITPECYLSQKYATSDLAILRRHGLEMLSTTEFLHRVQSDLDPDRLSRMRSSIDADWHRRVARALQRPFLDKIGLPISSIRGMALVPLTDGSWQSTSDTTCYYAHVDGLEIPRGLGLSLVEPQASTQPERKRLFDFLGVKTATIAMIRQRIYDCYQTPIRDMSFTRSLSHLRFLYLTHQKAAANNRTGRDGIFSIGVLADMGEKWWCYTNPLTTDVYMPSDDPLSASQLLAPTPKSPERDDGAPGLPVHILDTGYLNDPPERPSADSPSWIDWLHDTMHIRRHIRLKNASANQMSRLAAYVAEHRPKKFTSLLKTLWPFQRGELVNSFGFLYELNRTLVLTRGNHHMYLLCNTFLPTRHLLDLAKRFFPDDDFFPWISLETEVVAQEQEWQQLVADTGTLLPKDDLAFVLKCLSGSWLPVASRFTGLDVDVVPKGIFDLYCFLEGQHKMSANKEEVSSRIRYVNHEYLKV